MASREDQDRLRKLKLLAFDDGRTEMQAKGDAIMALPAHERVGVTSVPGGYVRAPGEVSAVDNIIQHLGQGAGAAWTDEAVAGLASVVGPLIDKPLPYDQGLAMQRASLARGREDYPIQSTVAELAGALPQALAVPSAVAPATPVGRVATYGGLGALEGVIYGTGTGEGKADRFLKGSLGAAIGGAGGAGGAAVTGPLTKWVTNLLRRNPAARSAGVKAPSVAERVLRELGDEGEMGLAAMQLDETKRLIHAGPNARQLLDNATKNSPKAASRAARWLDAEIGKATKGVRDSLDNLFGERQGLRRYARGIAEGTKTSRQEAYGLAYSRSIDYSTNGKGNAILDVWGRIPNKLKRAAIEEANDEMRSLGQSNRQILFKVLDDGTIELSEMPNVMQIDHVKRALNKIAYAPSNLNPMTGQIADGAAARAARLSGELRRALGDAVPEYNAATALGGDKIEREVSLRLGRDLLKPSTTAEMVEEGIDGISDEALDAVKVGLRSHIDDMMDRVKIAFTDPNMDAREVARLLRDTSSQANRDKIRIVLGEQAADSFFRTLDDAIETYGIRAAVAQNSKTAVRRLYSETSTEATEGGARRALEAARPAEAGREAVRGLTGQNLAGKQARTDAYEDAIVRTLLEPLGRGNTALPSGPFRPPAAQLAAVPRLAQQAERNRRLTELLTTGMSVGAVPMVTK